MTPLEQDVSGYLGGAELLRTGPFTDLRALPADVIRGLQQLPNLLAYQALIRVTDPVLAPYLPQFLEEVVAGGEPLLQWRQGRFLEPALPLEVLLVTDALLVLSVLQPFGTAWLQTRASRESWSVSPEMMCAPGLWRPDLDYHFSPPAGVRDILPGVLPELHPVSSPRIAVRRWIAARLAQRLPPDQWLDPAVNPVATLAAAFPGLGVPSADAIAAINGLVVEGQLPTDRLKFAPGFNAPDNAFGN